MVACRKLMLILLVAGSLTGCKKQAPSSAEPRGDAQAESPVPPGEATAPAHETRETKAGREGTPAPAPHAGRMTDPHATLAGGTEAKGPQPTETALDGITLKVPQGWVYEVPRANQRMPSMSPKAVFRLAPVEGDTENVYVRVTHFPGMRVPDEKNLERWYAMLQQPDGRPTGEVSTVVRFQVGEVKVVLADVPGNMTVGGVTKTGWRMLGAIVKHEKGPHFVKVVGPARSVEHWKASVVAYLKSAKVN